LTKVAGTFVIDAVITKVQMGEDLGLKKVLGDLASA